jgi:hypothetical protein
MGERTAAYRVWWGNLKERDLKDIGINGGIMLKRIFKWDGGQHGLD